MKKLLTILGLITLCIYLAVIYKEPVGLDLVSLEKPIIEKPIEETYLSSAEIDTLKVDKKLNKEEEKIFDKVVENDIMVYDLSTMNVKEKAQDHINTLKKVGGEYEQGEKNINKQIKNLLVK